MANRWQWNVVTVDEIWAQFQLLLCLVLERLCGLSLTSTTEAQVLWLFGGRKILLMLLDFFLEDIRNLKGKVDVFCFVYRASTATSML